MKNRLDKEFSGFDWPGVEIKIDPNNKLIWRVIIKGPQGSAYQGGRFIVKITIPERYPFQHPEFIFETTMFHPNILPNGQLHCSVSKTLKREGWQPTFSMKPIIQDILNLFIYVHIEYPANYDAMKLYLTDQTQYNEEVRNYTKKYAV